MAPSFPAFHKKICNAPAFERIRAAFTGGNFPIEIEGAEGSAAAFLIADLSRAAPGTFLAVTPTEPEASALSSDLRALGISAPVLPWWGTMPYREIPPASAVFGERTAILAALAAGPPGIVIVPERAFLTPLPPPDYLSGLLLRLKPGGGIDTPALARTLTAYGYTRVPRVETPGEFALRGEVLDILMGGDDTACRVLFDFDQVESIKRFDPLDQSGLERVEELVIRPRKELVWTDERIDRLGQTLAGAEEFPDQGRAVLDALRTKGTAPGEELLFPLAFDEPSLITGYIGEGGTLFCLDRERLENAQEVMDREYERLYQQVSRERAVPRPDRIFRGFREIAARMPRQVSFMNLKGKERRLSLGCEPSRSFFGNINYLKEEFTALMRDEWDLFVAAESDIQAGRITEILRDTAQAGQPGGPGRNAMRPRGETSPSLTIAALPLSAGFAMPEVKFMLIQENEIFGRRQRSPRSLKNARSVAIDTFVELNPGDYVVHVNYGIGLFKSIERVRAQGHERDYVQLEYAEEEVVFVPIEQVNLVQRYIGKDGASPRLDMLGSKRWEGRKSRVRKSVENIAEQLIALYSRRKQSPGFAFPQDSEWQTMFEAAFPFEETPDQLRCVEEIKEDMEKPFPMDRLICGDVGYGKTEVAVRACFKAVMGGKQVAFLAPTTILAEQHFENFQERFAQFPIQIAMLSRFVEAAIIRKNLAAVKKGEIDILVGTQRIIQKDVIFKDLGLLVVDEEQRFGVRDKERLKEIKTTVDCLALSATPIPRTLHMSLLKIRDMSLLSTPPRNRHPIETVIEEFSEERLAAALRQEAERHGQIFYLHNRVEDLRETRLMLERLVPEMLVDTAHGQMDARELEDVMHRFVHGGFHVLVSTTIIENGIDIPNVNTIIIDRADVYGASQLYQLRGRVGRSDRVAYAYLFYPKDRALTDVAMKRLQVISDFTELGSGFKIAMKDMEIRGAGNLLGREQSGDIYSVGFDLYLRLLDDAVRRLQDENYEGETDALLELEYTGFIPDGYIDSAQEKMEVYKKIASVKTREELERVYVEIVDRFGPPPDEASSLLALAELRILCRDIAVTSIKEREGCARVELRKVSLIKIDRLLRMIKESGGKVRLDPEVPNVLLLKTGNISLREKSEFIR
ncbi:MAG: transcription-repair coupling factor, partial [Treponema sp.]|nr:transcription-repair coupling factor [Treponema sp.]